MNARLQGALFAGVCLLGAAASVGLTVREVARTAPIAMSVTDTTRSGETSVVTVSVRNTTDDARCVVVQVAARDRAGHDLAKTTTARSLTLPAHARRTVIARLTLTTKERSEQLHAFYPSSHACESGN